MPDGGRSATYSSAVADRTLVEAVADLRLDDKKLNADLRTIQRSLLRSVANIERDARVTIGVQLDTDEVAGELQGLADRLSDQGSIVLPVDVDADQALQSLGQVARAADNIEVNQQLELFGVDEARGEIQALQTTASEPLEFEVGVDSDKVASGLQAVNTTARRAGENAGTSFGQAFSRTAQGIIATAAGVAGGFLAKGLVSGFARLQTIEDSTASLTVQLGSASEAAKVLDDVLAVVTGTPFNLDQFANAASQMISFGVAAEDVPLYLEAIGEAAATRGSQANEFAQRLSITFGQISSLGRIGGEDIRSLSDVGVNALEILGNSFGQTTEGIRDMIADGAIPAEQALKILSDGIINGSTGINGATVAFGGTMEKLRLTMSGAIGGFSSATARFGAGIIGPLQETLTGGFNGLTGLVNNFNTVIKASLADIGDSGFIEGVQDFFVFLPEIVDPAVQMLERIGPAIAPLTVALGGTGLGALKGVLGPLGAFVPTLGGLPGILIASTAAFAAFTPEIREQLVPILGEVGELFAQIGGVATVVLADGLEAATPAISRLVEATAGLIPLASAVVDVASALAFGLVPALEAFSFVVDKIPVGVLTALLTALVGYKAVTFLQGPNGLFGGITRGLEELAQPAQLAFDGLENGAKRTETSAGLFTRSIGRMGISAQQFQSGVNKAAIGVGGALAGIALTADDTATQVTGALGAISAVAAGAATGGAPGAIVAGVGVAAGVAVGFLKNMGEQQRQVEARSRELGLALADNTQELIKNKDALIAVTTAAEGAELAYSDLGESILDSGEEGEKAALALSAFSIPSSGIEGGQELVRVLQQIGALGDPDGDVAKVPEILAAFEGAFGEDAEGLLELISRTNSLAGIKNGVFVELGVQFKDLSLAQQELIIQAEALQDLSQDNDLTGALREQIKLTAARDADYESALKQAEAALRINRYSEDQNELLALQGEIYRLLGFRATDASNYFTIAQLEAQGFSDASITALTNIAAAAGQPISMFVDLDTDDAEAGVDGVTHSVEELEEQERRATDRADELTAAFQEADLAVQGIEDSIDRLLGNFDRTKAVQNFEASLRGVSEALAAESDVEGFNIGDLLQGQAEFLGLSILDLLESAPTEEARQFFQDEIGGALEAAKTLIEGAAIGDAPLSLILESQQIQEQLLAGFLANGLDQATAEGLVETYFNTDVITEAVITSLNAGINAKSVELGNIAAGLEDGLALGEDVDIGEKIRAAADDLIRFKGLVDAGVLLETDVDLTGIEETLANFTDPAFLDQYGIELDAETVDALTAIQTLLDGVPDSLDIPVTVTPTPSAETNLSRFSTYVGGYDPKNGIGRSDGVGNARTTIERSFAENPIQVAVRPSITALDRELREYEGPGVVVGVDADTEDYDDELDGVLSATDSVAVEVEAELDPYNNALNRALDASRSTEVDVRANLTPANRAIETFIANTRRQGFTVSLTVPPRNITSDRPANAFEDGGFVFFRNGGLSGGDFPHMAHIAAPGTMRVFAEPETGGEAYIPLATHKRQRSTAILEQVADMFGLDVAPRVEMPEALATTVSAPAISEAGLARAIAAALKSLPSAAARQRYADAIDRSVTVEKIEVSGVRDPMRAVNKMITRLSDVAARGYTDWDEWER